MISDEIRSPLAWNFPSRQEQNGHNILPGWILHPLSNLFLYFLIQVSLVYCDNDKPCVVILLIFLCRNQVAISRSGRCLAFSCLQSDFCIFLLCWKYGDYSHHDDFETTIHSEQFCTFNYAKPLQIPSIAGIPVADFFLIGNPLLI